MVGMEITLLSVPDCPHVGLTRRRLEEAVRRSGVVARISEEVVASDADAARRTFVGSPTVLADGRDLFPDPSVTPALACRLYPGDDGPSGAPSVEALIDALTSTDGTAERDDPTAGDLSPGTAPGDSSLAEQVRWAAFDRLVTGKPVAVAVLAEALDVDVAAVRDVVADQARRGLVDVDERGRIVGAHGLTLAPTDHELVLGDVVVHTWCALDAIGIPATLGVDARATITAGDGEPVTIELPAGEPLGTGEAAMWLPTGPCEDLRADFCAQANLFTTRAALDAWRVAAGDPPGRELMVSEAAALGRSWWSRR
jgi:hypothetical protein